MHCCAWLWIIKQPYILNCLLHIWYIYLSSFAGLKDVGHRKPGHTKQGHLSAKSSNSWDCLCNSMSSLTQTYFVGRSLSWWSASLPLIVLIMTWHKHLQGECLEGASLTLHCEEWASGNKFVISNRLCKAIASFVHMSDYSLLISHWSWSPFEWRLVEEHFRPQ